MSRKRGEKKVLTEADREKIRIKSKKHRESAAFKQKILDKKAAGICVLCNEPAVVGKTKCQKHRDEASRVYFSRGKRKRGECQTCPNKVVAPNRTCDDCKDKQKQKREDKRKQWRADGLCVVCGAATDGSQKCDKHREQSRQRRRQIKIEVLAAYGGAVCVCCGEDTIEFLTLEHPDMNGAEHRKAFGGGSEFYKQLKKAGFPKDILMVVNCFNCNCAKMHGDVCPHELKRQKSEKNY